jgi:hypothetical protein
MPSHNSSAIGRWITWQLLTFAAHRKERDTEKAIVLVSFEWPLNEIGKEGYEDLVRHVKEFLETSQTRDEDGDVTGPLAKVKVVVGYPLNKKLARVEEEDTDMDRNTVSPSMNASQKVHTYYSWMLCTRWSMRV